MNNTSDGHEFIIRLYMEVLTQLSGNKINHVANTIIIRRNVSFMAENRYNSEEGESTTCGGNDCNLRGTETLK